MPSSIHKHNRAFAMGGARQRAIGAAVLAGLILAMTGWAAMALAAGGQAPLRIIRYETNAVHPTRVHLVVEVAVLKPSTHWRVEYVACDEEVAACEGKLEQDPRILGSGELQGQADAPAETHHLTPNTTYYARAVVSNGTESASKAIFFKTPAATAPEVSELKFANGGQGNRIREDVRQLCDDG